MPWRLAVARYERTAQKIWAPVMERMHPETLIRSLLIRMALSASPFRTADLLELAGLIGELRQGAGSVPDDVKRITP
jgi:hypothetical protein